MVAELFQLGHFTNEKEKQMTKLRVCDEDEFTIGEKRLMKAGDKRFIVFRLEDGYYATQHRCTHTFAPLQRGKILDGSRIECPLHRAEFDIRTGAVDKWAKFPPGIQLLSAVRSEKALATYPITIEEGVVYIDLP